MSLHSSKSSLLACHVWDAAAAATSVSRTTRFCGFGEWKRNLETHTHSKAIDRCGLARFLYSVASRLGNRINGAVDENSDFLVLPLPLWRCTVRAACWLLIFVYFNSKQHPATLWQSVRFCVPMMCTTTVHTAQPVLQFMTQLAQFVSKNSKRFVSG